MAAVSIRDLDDDVKERLRIRAAHNDAVADARPGADLFSALLDRFNRVRGVDPDVPSRAEPPEVADLTT